MGLCLGLSPHPGFRPGGSVHLCVSEPLGEACRPGSTLKHSRSLLMGSSEAQRLTQTPSHWAGGPGRGGSRGWGTQLLAEMTALPTMSEVSVPSWGCPAVLLQHQQTPPGRWGNRLRRPPHMPGLHGSWGRGGFMFRSGLLTSLCHLIF